MHKTKTDLPIAVFFIIIFFSSCVSSKKLQQEQAKYDQLNNSYIQSQKDFEKCRSERDELTVRRSQLEDYVKDLNKQIVYLKENYSSLSDLSNKQAESLRKSIENVG